MKYLFAPIWFLIIFEKLNAPRTNYLETLPHWPVASKITLEELRLRLVRPLPETGMAPDKVIDELVRDIDDGILRSSSGRFFGWVIGGALPVALAADWLTLGFRSRRHSHS